MSRTKRKCPTKIKLLILRSLEIENYLKLTDACQTKANKINKTGITGKTSTIGEKGAYASGSFATISALDINENKCVIRVLLIIFYFIVGY